MLKIATLFIFLSFSFLLAQENMIVGVTPKSQVAIEQGLKFLASQQDAQGFWRADIGYKLNLSYKVSRENMPHVGITAMACMALMASGSVPGYGEYGDNVRKGIQFLLDCGNKNSNGYITKYDTRMYSHAFATLCLAEAYGMTRQAQILPVLRKAVKLIWENQNAQGGWRYEPGALDADISITVCQVQALRAARNVGIHVPKKCIDRAIEYIRLSAAPDGGFYYQVMPDGESRESFALAAAGVTSLYGAGVYDDTLIRKGLEYLRNPPRYDPHPPNDHYFFYYGHYYAIQAMYMAGPNYWNDWYPKIRDELLGVQKNNGCWEDNVGTIYSTAVALIILQMPYNYLPILQR